ncbi:MAG: outer membrane protein transport protein [Pelagimonas sp.]|jgi:long-subunit fatty acid transport protein|nr:outer membrane protein transport protein [Pelagimonas sp.]
MKNTIYGALALTVAAAGAHAGGIERSSNDYGLLFQSGTHLNLSHAIVTPKVSGKYTDALTAAGGGEDSTGNMAHSFGAFGVAYKNDLNEKLSFGIYNNNPYGAGATYTQGFYNRLTADWRSNQTALMLRYSLSDRVSVYGGARYVSSKASLLLPDQLIRGGIQRSIVAGASEQAGAQLDGAGTAQFLNAAQSDLQTQLAGATPGTAQHGAIAAQLAEVTRTNAVFGLTQSAAAGAFDYSVNGARTGDWGLVLGAAYEIPDIALRVALTWESSITHKFDTTENLAALGIPADSETEVEMPQSVALDFQTGVAAGTLVFGGIKWTEWSKWEVRTPGYESVTGDAITGFDNDVMTYRLGVGRQFNEKLSGFAQVTYEASHGDPVSRLAPTDGRLSIGLGGQYTEGKHKLRAGIEYVSLGDAEDASGVQFEGNSAIGVGISYTASF